MRHETHTSFFRPDPEPAPRSHGPAAQVASRLRVVEGHGTALRHSLPDPDAAFRARIPRSQMGGIARWRAAAARVSPDRERDRACERAVRTVRRSWRGGIGLGEPRMSARRSWLVRALSGAALRAMPVERRVWAQAMCAEADHVCDDERLSWAFGCLWAAIKLRFDPMNTGDYRVSRWVMLVETIGGFGPLCLGWYLLVFVAP